jgi:hypothetical protein
MNRTVKILTFLALATTLAFGQQYTVSSTTLSSAIATPNVTTINLSTTSMLSSGPSNQINTVLYVDYELMRVITVIDSTHALVQRGVNQTRPFVHASGATVLFNPSGSPITANFFSNQPVWSESWGSCLNTNEQMLKKVYVTTGDIFDCKQTGAAGTSGQWVLVGHGTMAPAGQTVSAFCTGALTSGGTDYIGNNICATTSALVKQLVTSPGTLANLYVVAGTAVTGGSAKDVLTVQKNGTDTAITCTFATGGAATTCSDTAHSVQVVAGDLITFKFVTATSDAGTDISVKVGLY